MVRTVSFSVHHAETFGTLATRLACFWEVSDSDAKQKMGIAHAVCSGFSQFVHVNFKLLFLRKGHNIIPIKCDVRYETLNLYSRTIYFSK
jgi:hypothetical protein